jgi:transcriptional pleiotropic regulator of transition state genes
MVKTGLVRRIDELGRICIPREILKSLGLKNKNKSKCEPGSALEIYADGDKIILSEYEPGCVFCGERKDVIYYKGKFICKECSEEIGGN